MVLLGGGIFLAKGRLKRSVTAVAPCLRLEELESEDGGYAWDSDSHKVSLASGGSCWVKSNRLIWWVKTDFS